MMDSNEDASRILKGMLNIGERSSSEAGNSLVSLLPQDNNEQTEGYCHKDEPLQSNNSFSTDSFGEQDTFRLEPVRQFVHFTKEEQQGSVSIYANEVHIKTDFIDVVQSHTAGSNRVKVTPVVNYEWESKFCNGQLLSASRKYLAYVLGGKKGFRLRILNRKTVVKGLIKDFHGSIDDVSFAHYDSDLLACIDCNGDIFVWTISESNDEVKYSLKLHVIRGKKEIPKSLAGNCLVWCPNVATDDDDDENISEQVLAVCFGNIAEVLHIDSIIGIHGNTVNADDIQKGVVRVNKGHNEVIADIALAPDGSVLATASEDGGVKFWQLDFQQSTNEPHCLHEWQPHEGQPLSTLIFCDNHLLQDDKSPFWRFLITGGQYDSELKIWCTVTWSCLQTIRFTLPASSLTLENPPPLKLKASLDLSAQYLVLSDINRKVLYIFILHQNIDDGKAHVTSVAHFILTQPLLSFVISDAKMLKASVKDSMDQNSDEDDCKYLNNELHGESEESKPIPTVRVKLYAINPKAMQELTIQYHPNVSISPVTQTSLTASSVTNSETVIDRLSDVSGLDASLTEIDDLETKSENSAPKLFAPSAFATQKSAKQFSPAENNPDDASKAVSASSSITTITSINNSSDKIDERTNESRTSENDYSFKTCDEVTLQEQRGCVSSWFEKKLPSEVPLPDSPDPSKFSHFKPAVNQPSEDDNSGISHSTPLRGHISEFDDDVRHNTAIEDELPPVESHPFSSPPESKKQIDPPEEKPVDLKQAPYLNETKTEDVVYFPPGFVYIPPGLTELEEEKRELGAKVTENSNECVTPSEQIDVEPLQTVPMRNTKQTLDSLRDEIREIRELIFNQQQQQNDKMTEVLKEEIAVIEGVISSKLESIMDQHKTEQDQMFEKFTRDKLASEKQRFEKMTTSITNAVQNKVEKTAKNEIRSSVGSGFQKISAPLQDQLNTIMSQKLSATDEVLREAIANLVKEKTVVDAIGKTVGDAIQVSLLASMNEFFNKTMLPGFEKSCRAMYAQINSAFESGTQEYIQNFEGYAENRKEIEKQQKDNIVEQLQILVQNFQVASEKLSTTMSGNLLEMMQTQLASSMKRLQSSLLSQLQDDLNKSLHETIQKEVSGVLAEQSILSNDGRSQSQQRNTQIRIEQLIKEKKIPDAFQEALTAGDLSLVIMVCQSCDPEDLFREDPSPLSQPILLSLIQQLSVDLSSETELKHRYLQEAVLALDTEDPVTKEHVSSILGGLVQQLTHTVRLLSQTDSSNPLQRPLKRLLLAAKSLIK